MTTQIADVQRFWDDNPCGVWLSDAADRRRFFAEIEERRYRVLDGIVQAIARFDQLRGRDVLEIGCGAGTDGLQFTRGGARYTGVDLTATAIALAHEQFELLDAPGAFLVTNAERLPFADASFDHVYSFGVIHHAPDTERIVAEIHRVLRPGGTFCVMVYNKSSLNYYLQIMFLRRLLRLALYPRFMPALVARGTGLPEWKLRRHRELLHTRRHMSRDEWISSNTDGPDCPLAKVYDQRAVVRLFRAFEEVCTYARFIDRSHWPWLGPRLPRGVVRWLGERWGWFRVVEGTKGMGRGAPQRTAATTFVSASR